MGVKLPKHTRMTRVRSAIEKLMAPYDEKKQMRPYKHHLPQEQISLMAQHYESESSDLCALTAHLKEWTVLPGGQNEKGLYVWSTYNPLSTWDW